MKEGQNRLKKRKKEGENNTKTDILINPVFHIYVNQERVL